MHTVKVCRPSAHLRQYVRTFVQREITASSATIISPTTAQLEQILAFDFGVRVKACFGDGTIVPVDRASLGGAHTRFACDLELCGGVESFGIFFRPTGILELFGIPMYELFNHLSDATAIIGPEVQSLWNQLAEQPTFEARVRIAEEFLMPRVVRAQARSGITAAVDYIFQQHGAVNINRLADQGFSGLRQFERQFRLHVGASPKTFARVARFQAALDAKVSAPQRTWLDIAHHFGYYDQMHMIHDFEKLGHNSPTRLVAQLGDSRPPALVPSDNQDSATLALR
jgi:AraC-like DNA-binding protein